VVVLVFVAGWGIGMKHHVRRANDVGLHACMFRVWKEAHVWRMKRRMRDCRRFWSRMRLEVISRAINVL
jgi:hypothetical protein